MIYSLAVLLSCLFLFSLPFTAATNDPTEIRLAYGSPEGFDAMSISFTVDKVFSSTPTIIYGSNANNLNQSSNQCNNHSYGTKQFYDCVINNLSSNTIYYYQINADSAGPSSASSIYSFRSGKSSSEQDPSLRLIVVGDMGVKNSDDTLASMKKLTGAGAGNNTSGQEIDMVLHIGDLSYADDYYLRWGDNYEGSWEKWQIEMEPVTSITPYMTLPGNHEVTCTEATPFLCPEGQKNFTAYRHRFHMPDSVQNLWYSFNAGLVHFIQINTESDFPGSPEGPGTYLGGGGFGNQTEWLLNDLIEASKPENRAVRPWIIVSGHRPFYTSASSKGCDACRTAWEQMFIEYGVDIYFAGHVHWYERLYAIINEKITNQDYSSLSPQDGPVYIVNGAAGNVEGHSTGSQGSLSAFVDDSHYGYGILEIENSTTINWAFYNAADESLIDKITIVRKH